MERLDDIHPRIRDKLLFVLLSPLGRFGWQLAFAWTHRNRKWV